MFRPDLVFKIWSDNTIFCLSDPDQTLFLKFLHHFEILISFWNCWFHFEILISFWNFDLILKCFPHFEIRILPKQPDPQSCYKVINISVRGLPLFVFSLVNFITLIFVIKDNAADIRQEKNLLKQLSVLLIALLGEEGLRYVVICVVSISLEF